MAAPQTKPGPLKALLTVHKAMLAAQLIFSAVAFYLVYSVSFYKNLQYPERTLQVLAIAFAAAGFYAGTFLFKKKLSAARESQADIREKFAIYQYACIVQWALIEVPCLFILLCFLLTGNYAFLALAIVLMLVFTMMAPSRLKLIFHLQLSEEEIAEL